MTSQPLASSTRAMQSPIAAARPWPTCSGPVGLAETYSTPARVAVAGCRCGRSARPARWISRNCALLGRRREVEIDEAGAGDLDLRRRRRWRGSAATSACASARGLAARGLASSIAALLEKSPWLRSFGRSITNAGRGEVGGQGAAVAQGGDALVDQGAELGFHEGFWRFNSRQCTAPRNTRSRRPRRTARRRRP